MTRTHPREQKQLTAPCPVCHRLMQQINQHHATKLICTAAISECARDTASGMCAFPPPSVHRFLKYYLPSEVLGCVEVYSSNWPQLKASRDREAKRREDDEGALRLQDMAAVALMATIGGKDDLA